MPGAYLNTLQTSDTNFSNLQPTIWAKSIIRIADRESFWTQLAGPEGSRAAVIEKRELMERPGATVRFSVTGRLNRKVNTGSSALKNNEEKMPFGSFTVTIGLRRTATARDYMVDVTSIVDFMADAWPALKDWAKRDMDDQVFEDFVNGTGAATTEIKRLYANNRANRAALASGDVLTTIELMKLHNAARRRGVEPIQRVGRGLLSEPVYMAGLSEADYYQLRADPDYKQDVRHAGIRGGTNPVFQGVVTDMYQGILLYIHGGVNNGDGKLGSFLRPEAELMTTMNSSVTTCAAGPSATGSAISNVDYWGYFPDVTGGGVESDSTHTIRIDSEDISYTPTTGSNPGDSNNTVVRAAKGTSAASHTAGALITLRNLGRVMAFGPEAMLRAWARMSERTGELEDYGNEIGVGIRYVNGVAGVQSTDSSFKNAVLLETWSPSVSTI